MSSLKIRYNVPSGFVVGLIVIVSAATAAGTISVGLLAFLNQLSNYFSS